MTEAEFDTRYDRDFGYGKLVGSSDVDFSSTPPEELVYQIGWSHACPVVDVVIEEYGRSWAETHTDASREEVRENGIRLTIERYAECNFVFGLIINRAIEVGVNPELGEALLRPVLRLENEPFGIADSKFAPPSAAYVMSPLSTLIGYALPRVVIEQMGREGDRTPERFLAAIDMIDDVLSRSTSPTEFVIALAEAAASRDADPRQVLSHLLAKGILHEQNCVTMANAMFGQMHSSAPILFEAYNLMTPEERADLEMIEFPLV